MAGRGLGAVQRVVRVISAGTSDGSDSTAVAEVSDGSDNLAVAEVPDGSENFATGVPMESHT